MFQAIVSQVVHMIAVTNRHMPAAVPVSAMVRSLYQQDGLESASCIPHGRIGS
jgi:hypothetical protein